MPNGWIKLHRKVLDNPRASNPKWLALWARMMLMATHEPYKTIFDGKEITLLPGQFITSRQSLEKESGINRGSIDRLLATMKNEQQIVQQASNRSRLITITNWAAHQEIVQPIVQPPCSHRAATVHKQEGEEQKNTKNQDKNSPQKKPRTKDEIEEKLRNDNPLFFQFWDLWPKKQARKDALKAWLKNNCDEHFDLIMKKLPQFIQSQQWRKDRGQYIPLPATWLNKERWQDELGIEMGGVDSDISREAAETERLTQEALRTGKQKPR